MITIKDYSDALSSGKYKELPTNLRNEDCHAGLRLTIRGEHYYTPVGVLLDMIDSDAWARTTLYPNNILFEDLWFDASMTIDDRDHDIPSELIEVMTDMFMSDGVTFYELSTFLEETYADADDY